LNILLHEPHFTGNYPTDCQEHHLTGKETGITENRKAPAPA